MPPPLTHGLQLCAAWSAVANLADMGAFLIIHTSCTSSHDNSAQPLDLHGRSRTVLDHISAMQSRLTPSYPLKACIQQLERIAGSMTAYAYLPTTMHHYIVYLTEFCTTAANRGPPQHLLLCLNRQGRKQPMYSTIIHPKQSPDLPLTSHKGFYLHVKVGVLPVCCVNSEQG
jgi:hypothetical protein